MPLRRRRALHDLLAGSRVVRAPKRGISWKHDARLALPGKVELAKRL